MDVLLLAQLHLMVYAILMDSACMIQRNHSLTAIVTMDSMEMIAVLLVNLLLNLIMDIPYNLAY
eukprot:CAMPEP_0196764022 /NCGR_PEP_ID=MMETSP1095-20130614/5239_1 /TAXON_ID=96789 ORGANISM="Chromulina nebulosa, Strain UTEXLB2642" /NCGR_SAMPLE_ID=MMETSP1095 /ASSEMBLY_ACC=CAM_ASM_000446 /LENGTH=63 /DNA_ID=CAMNT_0042118529 /DNA_START=496 /DNA_END=687 /DNA_ORIENTATION=+